MYWYTGGLCNKYLDNNQYDKDRPPLSRKAKRYLLVFRLLLVFLAILLTTIVWPEVKRTTKSDFNQPVLEKGGLSCR